MPRIYRRRATTRARNPESEQEVTAEAAELISETIAEETPEQEAAPEAASSVPDTPSCAMTERKWRGQYPVWQCRKCRFDTMDSLIASAARKKCHA